MTSVRHFSRLLPAVALAAALAACERPPVENVQLNYRGLGAAEIINPRTYAEQVEASTPPAPLPAVTPLGRPASSAYQNVPVLGHVDVAEFTRQMTAMTAWVSPQAGCVYCHQAGNLAVDSPYTKVVSRRMIQMNQYINERWRDHVGPAGVTCWTCHRGEPVPAEVWTFGTPERDRAVFPPSFRDQNRANPEVGLSSLPGQPFPTYFYGDADIRLQGPDVTGGGHPGGVKAAEETYGLMMHMSQALDVNCTYCHNSPRMADWEQSTPARAVAWQGIRMVRDLNVQFMAPLSDVLPANRKGPMGDTYKINCATCHQGAYRPSHGRSIAEFYPALLATRPASFGADPAVPGENLRQMEVEAQTVEPDAVPPPFAPETEAPPRR